MQIRPSPILHGEGLLHARETGFDAAAVAARVRAMLETDRLILRRWRDSDREPFAAMGRDEEVMRHFPSLLTREESDAMMDNRIEAHFAEHGFGLWAVERKSDGCFQGFTGLIRVTVASPIEGEVEVGWRLAREAWGHGYATEAARASLDYGFGELGLGRIVAMVVAANTRSRSVMERLGMTRCPRLDFDHPRVPVGSPVRAHMVYAIDAP